MLPWQWLIILSCLVLAPLHPLFALADDRSPKPDPYFLSETNFVQEGSASWYGERFRGRKTASGEPFDPSGLTAAHRSLPFGVLLKVTNLENGRTVVVRINDRGPCSRRRIIDLSKAAAEKLAFIRKGRAKVRIESLTQAQN